MYANERKDKKKVSTLPLSESVGSGMSSPSSKVYNPFSIFLFTWSWIHGVETTILGNRSLENTFWMAKQIICPAPWDTWSAYSWPHPCFLPCRPKLYPGSKPEQQYGWPGCCDVMEQSQGYWTILFSEHLARDLTLVKVFVTSPQCTSYSFPYISST